MKKINISTKGIYIRVGVTFLFLTICFNLIIFQNTKNLEIRIIIIIFSLLFFMLGVLLIILIRRKVIIFSDYLNTCIDNIIYNKENDVTFDLESETLNSKLNYKLKRLYEIMQNSKKQIQEEKQSIQEIISDISHQVKMPVTNLKMYNSMLLDSQLTKEKEKEVHNLMESQINKLEFLMQSMVKMSRLETGIITLNVLPAPIYDTIGLALAGIVISAEKKNIEVIVDCDPTLTVLHDKKWTAEALFNILDNGVKYTPLGGKISVTVDQWEMVTKIDITDTGKGIAEQELGKIFKRFYRERDVHDIDGVGIGLYLCREIISKQGGYIQVKSEIGKGSTFSVFFPN